MGAAHRHNKSMASNASSPARSGSRAMRTSLLPKLGSSRRALRLCSSGRMAQTSPPPLAKTCRIACAGGWQIRHQRRTTCATAAVAPNPTSDCAHRVSTPKRRNDSARTAPQGKSNDAAAPATPTSMGELRQAAATTKATPLRRQKKAAWRSSATKLNSDVSASAVPCAAMACISSKHLVLFASVSWPRAPLPSHRASSRSADSLQPAQPQHKSKLQSSQ
mmetsp:Transcript_31521/g.86814  ORF Transcript_31521/g.86814 Transcript_31521/m.86814 type:complete len:220 (+) Transcript_31521:1871-2530(+)